MIYNINQVSLRQAITPERIQGRMNATMRFLVWGTIPARSDHRRPHRPRSACRGALAVGGSSGCLSFVPILFSSVRTLQRIPTPEPAAPASALLDSDADMVGPGPTLK